MIRLTLLLALGAASLPVFAYPGLAGDSAEQPLSSSAIQPAAELATLPERNVAFASDINQLIATQSSFTAAPDSRMQTVLKRALALLGTPYRWGGATPDNGFDCSGLVGYVFRAAGIELPRVSREMAHEGRLISDRGALAAGDLVFFGRRGNRVDHVGIYMGEGRFLHAPRSGKDVEVSSLETGYWSGRFVQARRVADI